MNTSDCTFDVCTVGCTSISGSDTDISDSLQNIIATKM